MDKVIIIGGKGTAVVLAEQILDAASKFQAKIELLGFAFDDESFGSHINDIPVVSKTKEAYLKYEKHPDVKFIFSLYRSDLIKERIALRESYGIPIGRYYNFIHPLATVTKSVIMGQGNVVLSGTVINPGVKLGNHNTFNSCCLIGHDSILGDSNFVAGHAVIGSNLMIQNGNFFGLNCSIKNFVKIGNHNIVGMAANVVKNVESDEVLIGNPAKVVRQNE